MAFDSSTILKIFNALVSVATAVGIYFGSIVLYPSFQNEKLSQTGINHSNLSIIVMIILTATMLVISNRFNKKKYSVRYLIIAIVFVAGFFIFLFNMYYPFRNKKILYVAGCDAYFFIGEKFKPTVPPEQTATAPEILIHGAACRPEHIWTEKSIERNYKLFMANFIVAISLFTIGILAAIHALFCLGPDQPT